MADERRPVPGQRLTAEQVAELQEMDRQFQLEVFPPQVDVNGMERVCVQCHQPLNPLHNRNYDGSVGGFCNKLCRKEYEKKLQLEGMATVESETETDKYEEWRPKKHSPVAG